MQDDGAVVVEDVGATIGLGVIIGVIGGDDPRGGGQDGTLTEQKAVVVAAVIGPPVVDHHDQPVDGGQFNFPLHHVGDGVLVEVDQAQLLVLGIHLRVHDVQAELGGKVPQGGLLAVDDQGRIDARRSGDHMAGQGAHPQHCAGGLEHQPLPVHPPVRTGAAGHLGHGVGGGQLLDQLAGFPGFHSVDADEGLLAARDGGGGVVGVTVPHQGRVLVGVEGVIKAGGANGAAVVQAGRHRRVRRQDPRRDDGIGEGRLLVHKALVDFGVKGEAAKSAGRHRLLLSYQLRLERTSSESCWNNAGLRVRRAIRSAPDILRNSVSVGSWLPPWGRGRPTTMGGTSGRPG